MIQTVYLTLAGNISLQEAYGVQEDRNLSKIRCVLRGYEGITGDTAHLRATKPDGHRCVLLGIPDSESSFLFTLTQDITALAGDVHCDVCIDRGSDRISSDTFLLKIRPPATEDTPPEAGKTLIRGTCADQELQIVQAPTIASGGFGENRLAVSFGPLWDEFTKTAVFFRDEDNVYHALLDENDTCTIPHEVLQDPGKLYFGIFGVNKDNVTRTSGTVSYPIVQGSVSEGTKPEDPTPELYQQILAKLGDGCITVTGTEESDTDGGDNRIFFSDGTVLTVKNGKKGDDYVLTEQDLEQIVARVLSVLPEGAPTPTYTGEVEVV